MATPEDRLQKKREKVTKEKARVSSTSILIVLILGAMIGGGVFLSQSDGGEASQVKRPKSVERIAVTDRVDYTQKRVDMKTVDYKVIGDSVTFSLEDIKEHKLIRFEYKSPKLNVKQRNFAGKQELPVMALIDPKGKLMVGVSYCEPCRSTSFHTEKDLSLTCNICNTKWDIETLVAWSGACMPFPPDEIKVRVEDGKVWIPKKVLEDWEPREEA